MADHRVVLISGETIELRRSVLVKEEPDLVFRCGQTEYRFNWKLVAYYTSRRDPHEDDGV